MSSQLVSVTERSLTKTLMSPPGLRKAVGAVETGSHHRCSARGRGTLKSSGFVPSPDEEESALPPVASPPPLWERTSPAPPACKALAEARVSLPEASDRPLGPEEGPEWSSVDSDGVEWDDAVDFEEEAGGREEGRGVGAEVGEEEEPGTALERARAPVSFARMRAAASMKPRCSRS